MASSIDFVEYVCDQLGGAGGITYKKMFEDYGIYCVFAPLGIDTPKPITFANKEEHLAFYRKKCANGWVVDPGGRPAAGWGLCLRLKDMATIGQLMLNQGCWGGRHLVPAPGSGKVPESRP